MSDDARKSGAIPLAGDAVRPRRLRPTLAVETKLGLSRRELDLGAPAPTPVLAAELVVISHPFVACITGRYPLPAGQTIAIGRQNDCTISFPEVPSISRQHAQVVFDGSRVQLDDLGSRYGIWIGGERLSGRITLGDGDRFRLPTVSLQVVISAEPEAAWWRAVHDLVATDPLTEVASRSSFDAELQRETARARRRGRALSLLIVALGDLDRHRRDVGHLMADVTLQRVAGCARAVAGAGDLVARIDDARFALLLPEIRADEARRIGDELLGTLAARPWDTAPPTCTIAAADNLEAMQDLLRSPAG